MTPTDEEELHRLSELLRLVDSQLQSNSSAREALQKAGIALIITFLHGRRQELEEWYKNLDAPSPTSSVHTCGGWGSIPRAANDRGPRCCWPNRPPGSERPLRVAVHRQKTSGRGGRRE